MAEFKIFRDIIIGGITKERLISKLVESGVRFNKYANMLFEHPSFSLNESAEHVKLVRVKSSELGISAPCPFHEIVTRASSFGLRLCPLYLGAFLRLEYKEQVEGPYLTVASNKPENDENFPNGFYLRNFEDSLWLRGYCATDDYEWQIDSEFVFLKKAIWD